VILHISDERDSFQPGIALSHNFLRGPYERRIMTSSAQNNFYKKDLYSYLDLDQLKSNHTAKSKSYKRYTFNNAPLVTVSLSV